MDSTIYNSTSRLFRQWFKRKHKRPDPFYLDCGKDEGEDNLQLQDHDSVRSMDLLTDELRVFVGTWNVAGISPVGSLAVDVDEWLDLKDAADVYVLGFQEIVPLIARNVIRAEDSAAAATNWNLLIGKTLNNKYGYQSGALHSVSRASVCSQTATPARDEPRIQSEQPNRGSRYKLMASKKMVGVFITVWMNRELLRRYSVPSVKVCSVGCGIMGYLGNKGSVSVSMSIGRTSFCFIAAHLASGEKKGDEGRRNHQVSEIFRRTYFPRLPRDGDNRGPLTILGHDQIFWFGDLNYRLYLEDNFARQLIQKQDWRALQRFDQLQRELEYRGVFQSWKEGNIEFAPTYKYSKSNCNRYSGGLPFRAGEKQRTPAWCDRILWYGDGVKQLSYFRTESKFSDHRPVSALFLTQINIVKCTNPTAIPLQPSTSTII